ncbi:MAG: porin [Pseudomonadota bacterium]
MKKTLLGTTALVAVGLLAGPALASDPLKVTVGGNVVTGFYYVDADNGASGTSYQDTKVAVVARNIDIIAEGTLDNGLTAGVDAKMMLGSDYNAIAPVSNATGDVTFRQLFAYLEGGFGRFEIGGTDGAAYKMHYTSPWFVPGNGVDSPNIYNAGGASPVRLSTFSLLATDANKVSYFTPRLAGFQLGVSYTPDAGNAFLGGRNVTANGLVLNSTNTFGLNLPQVTDVFEVAANYAGSFSGFDVGVDGFYTTGDSIADNLGATSSADPEEYGFGANVGYAGFTLGGAYYNSSDVGSISLIGSLLGGGGLTPVFATSPGAGATVWTAGLSYATGPWTVGVAYLNGEDDRSGSSVSNESWQAGGGYNLGSGVDVGLDLQLNSIDTGTTTFDTTSAGLVLAVSF